MFDSETRCPPARVSVVGFVHVSPTSSDRKKTPPPPPPAPRPPPPPPPATSAYRRRGSLNEIEISMCWNPCGSPLASGRHVVPPSVDLNRPPFVPVQTAFSHGPWRSSHIDA